MSVWPSLPPQHASGRLPCAVSCRRAYCSYADALFPPLWMGLLGTLAALQLLPLWQICLLGLLTFWGGLWLMAIKWAGVPASQLGLSRVTPMLTVCLELVCTGACVCCCVPSWSGSCC